MSSSSQRLGPGADEARDGRGRDITVPRGIKLPERDTVQNMQQEGGAPEIFDSELHGREQAHPNPIKAKNRKESNASRMKGVVITIALHGRQGVGKTHTLASLYDWITVSPNYTLEDVEISEPFKEAHAAIFKRDFDWNNYRTQMTRPECVEVTVRKNAADSPQPRVTLQFAAFPGELSQLTPWFKRQLKLTEAPRSSVLLTLVNPFRISTSVARASLLALFDGLQRGYDCSGDAVFHTACLYLFGLDRDAVTKILGPDKYIFCRDADARTEQSHSEDLELRDLAAAAARVADSVAAEEREYIARVRTLLNQTCHSLVICTHVDLLLPIAEPVKGELFREIRAAVRDTLELRAKDAKRPVFLVMRPQIKTSFRERDGDLELEYEAFLPDCAATVMRWITWRARIRVLSAKWGRYFGKLRKRTRSHGVWVFKKRASDFFRDMSA